MSNRPILYLILISSSTIKQSTSFAHATQQFEWSYKAIGKLALANFGTLPPDTILSINWEFMVKGVNGVTQLMKIKQP